MICQMCKHEWCWICKSDFPVHTPDCPNYQTYLELLEFQGLEEFEGNEELSQGRWFARTGDFGGLCFMMMSTLFLIIVVTPCIVVFNVLITPVYIFSMFLTYCNVDRRFFVRNFWMTFITVFLFISLYCCIPITFIIVTIPQLTFHYVKKCHEIKDLTCGSRNDTRTGRCRRYRKLTVNPVNNRLLRCVGLR